MAKRDEIVRALGKLETRGKGRAYPIDLREKIVAYVGDRRADGAELKAIGDEIGVSWRTLSQWSADARPAFRRVEVARPTPSSTFTVHGPRGVRVDGLDLDELADLLRRLA